MIVQRQIKLKMAASSKTISVLAPHSMNISKIKLKKGQQVSKGTIVCLYSTETNVTQKFKSNDGGIVAEIRAKEGEFIEKGSVLFTVQGCNHPTVMKDMCADCGADLRIENSTAGNRKEEVSASVAMVHSIPELIVSEELAKELGKADEERLIKTRKLVLLVDLDQTLIHTTNDNIPPNLKDVHHYQLWHGNQLLWYHTRLRPQTETFLKNISELYELHICTFGSRIYAHTIARILDPEGKYFSHRILSRDECFNAQSKTANLKALFPCGDAMVCIIDDREDVWHYSPNLVHVKPYRFFQGTADINAPPGLTKTEHDSETLVHRVRKVSQSSTGSKDEHSEDKTECDTEKNESRSSKKCAESESAKTEFENKIFSSEESGKCAESGKDEAEISEADKGLGKNSDSCAMETESVVENRNETDTSENKSEAGNENDMEETNCDEVTNTICKRKDGENADVDVKVENVGEKHKIEVAEKDEKSLITETMENQKNVVTNETGSGDGKDLNSKDLVRERDDKEKQIEEPERESDGKVSINEELVKETGDKVKGIENPEETDENKKGENVEDEWIEWDDEDDYLFYLEEILKTIHSAFFDFYDQLKDKESVEKGEEKSEKPSLKTLIPYIKKKVLKGCNILFSGVIPTNMTPEKSRAYIVAKSLGANIHTELKTKGNEKDLNDFTTHLVAGKHGTNKVRSAMKYKHVRKVSPDWLWSCAERWERVEEMLFPIPTASDTDDQGRDSPDVTKLMGNKSVAKRKRQTENGNDVNESDTKRLKKVSSSNELEKEDSNDFSSEANDTSDVDKKDENGSGNEKKPDNFSMSYNPMLAFSDDDLAYMDKEVEDEMDDEDQSSEDDNSRDCRFRKQVLKSKDLNDSSSEDSLSGAMPRGWGLKHKMSPKSSSEDEMKGSNSPGQEVGPEYESETDQDKFDKIMEAFGPETENSDEYAESIGSVDEEIADAVVKEFLS